MNALIIPAAYQELVRSAELHGLDDLQRVVGGFVELVTLGPNATLYLNEEGKLLGLPANGRATALAQHALMAVGLACWRRSGLRRI